MKLTVLGSGTTVPHHARGSAGFWLETHAGSIMLDCSAPAVRRMAQEDLDWPNLDAIWISHFHLDHCGGLAPFLAGTKHADEMKTRTNPLRIFGPVGLRRLLDAFDAVNDYHLYKQPFPVEVIEVQVLEKFEILRGVEAVAISTPHTPESLAIHLRDHNEKILVYTSDTGFDKAISSFAKSADLFITECSYLKDKPVEKHLELAEAMYLVLHARPKRAMFTHFYPAWDEIDFESEVKKFEPACEIIQAFDGLKFDISE